MNARNLNFVLDLAYGITILIAISAIAIFGTSQSIAFGIGVIISYVIHVVWKMSRFDPEWMAKEMSDEVEETVEETMEKTVKETVDKRVKEKVENPSEDDALSEQRINRR